MSPLDNELKRVPLDKASALAARFYTDPAMVEVERREVFARSWQLTAHGTQLEAAGDHVVGEIAGTPVLIVRGDDNVLRAFHNVCRHRAGPLATANGRHAKTLRCRYHGWTYALDGHLRAAPEMGDAHAFETASICLPEVGVREWQGLVFVALSDDVPDFGEVVDGIVDRIAPVDLAGMVFHSRVEYEVRCNWKVYVDNFLEGYHLPYVHPGLSKILDYRIYDTEVSEWYSLQHSPLRDAESVYGDGDAWYYFIFPNIMLNIMPDRLQTNVVKPIALDRCRVIFDYYFGGDGTARADADQRFSDEIQQEDIDICELVQKGLVSGGYAPGRLSPKREAGVWHFQNLLRDAYRRA